MNPELTTCYQILEIPDTAGAQEVREAYRTLVRVWHPDRFGSDPVLKEKANRKLQQINLAYETLYTWLNDEKGGDFNTKPQEGRGSDDADTILEFASKTDQTANEQLSRHQAFSETVESVVRRRFCSITRVPLLLHDSGKHLAGFLTIHDRKIVISNAHSVPATPIRLSGALFLREILSLKLYEDLRPLCFSAMASLSCTIEDRQNDRLNRLQEERLAGEISTSMMSRLLRNESTTGFRGWIRDVNAHYKTKLSKTPKSEEIVRHLTARWLYDAPEWLAMSLPSPRRK